MAQVVRPVVPELNMVACLACIETCLTFGFGFRALWRGTGPTIARLSVGLGIQMCVLESLKDAFHQRHLHLSETHALPPRATNAISRQHTKYTSFFACIQGLLGKRLLSQAAEQWCACR